MMGQRHADDLGSGAQPKRNFLRRLEAALAKVFKPNDTYHPEQYYLRGRPGPKAQAKQHHDDGK